MTSRINWNEVQFERYVDLERLPCIRPGFGDLWSSMIDSSEGAWTNLNLHEKNAILPLVKAAITCQQVMANGTVREGNKLKKGRVQAVVDLGVNGNFDTIFNIWVSVSLQFVLIEVNDRLSAYRSGVDYTILQLPVCSVPQPYFVCYHSTKPNHFDNEISSHITNSMKHSKVIAEWILGCSINYFSHLGNNRLDSFYFLGGTLFRDRAIKSWSLNGHLLFKVSKKDVITSIIIDCLQSAPSLASFPIGILPIISAYVYS